MNGLNMFNQIIQLFLIIGIGYYAKKRNIINEEVNKGFTALLLRITFPFLILNSFKIQVAKQTMLNMLNFFMFSILIFSIFVLVSKFFYIKFPHEKKTIAIFATIFSNCGFIGIPIAKAVYGDMGVIYTSIFNITYNLFVWTYGIMLFSGKKDFKSLAKVVVNPGIVAVIIGVLLMVFQITLPSVLRMTFEMVGNMTAPLSMMIIGYMLADLKITELFTDASIYYSSFIKLLVVPGITFFVLLAFKTDPLIRNVIVLCEAMPAGSFCGILAESYQKNPKYASQTIFLSTLLSILSIPVIIMLIN